MAREVQPPSAPSQLAAQKYSEVQNYDELIAAGVAEPFPILTLLVHGEGPEEEISEIDFGRRTWRQSSRAEESRLETGGAHTAG